MQLIPLMGPSVIIHACVIATRNFVAKIKKHNEKIIKILSLLIVLFIAFFMISIALAIIYSGIKDEHSTINLMTNLIYEEESH